jgi:hypothetical protein
LSAQSTIRASAGRLACCELRSKTHLSVNAFRISALDPVVLSGVIAVLLSSRFWPASLPHGRLIGHLAVVLECLGDKSLF